QEAGVRPARMLPTSIQRSTPFFSGASGPPLSGPTAPRKRTPQSSPRSPMTAPTHPVSRASSVRQARLDGLERHQPLLILVILLDAGVVGRLVLGADEGIGRPAPFGLEVQVTLVISDLVLEVLATSFLGAEAMDRLARIPEELLQLGAVRTLTGD